MSVQTLATAVSLLLLQLCTAACAEDVDYLRDIQPLLEHKCYACHGALRQQGELRVDTGALLLAGGDSGSPVVAGDPDNSLLLDVLTGEAGFRMPPDNEGAPLTAEELDLVRRWIASGARVPAEETPQVDPRAWWSYQPVTRPAVPPATDDWPRSPIDQFVAARRAERGLPRALEADRATWLRRVYVDLIGLPPTREELHRFLADESETAYETVVDDLLSRPQYGERWGRHWMDIWRYSDWYGSRGINEIRYSQRHIWRWRDWIIESLNADRGYDQMVREMLAADEIAGGDPKRLPATGFLGRNWYKFDRNVWMFETVERTGEAFLGLTFRCCRCHDHKFDPVTQEEYYRFRAFFEPHNVRTDPVSALVGTQKDATLGQVLSDGIALVYDEKPQAPTYLFERGDSRSPDESHLLTPAVPHALGGSLNIAPIDLPAEQWYPMLRRGARETLMEKANQAVADAEAEVKTAEAKLTAARERLEANNPDRATPVVVLADNFDAPNTKVWETLSGSWSYREGVLVQDSVTGFATIACRQTLPPDFRVQLKYRTLAPGTYRSVGFSFDFLDTGNSQDVYTRTGDAAQSVQAFHRLDGRQEYPRAGIVRTKLQVGALTTLDVTVVGQQLTIDLNGERELDYRMPVPRRDGRFALWVHQGAAEFLDLRIERLAESRETLERRVADAHRQLEIARATRGAEFAERESVAARLLAESARYLEPAAADRQRELDRAASRAERLAEVQRAELAVLQAGTKKARTDAEAKLIAARNAAEGDSTEYSPLGDQYPRTSTGRRRALADWVADRRNPRTARVAVNHIWGRHFGRPLAETPENFGLNGRSPSHPELLDWLACELMDNDWKMKSLHRLLVLSSTYRMSSAARNVPAADPENRFLWRMNARRLEAEAVRDGVLWACGRLDLKMGGPELSEADGETNPRRSIYFRNTPNEKMLMLEVFDMADPNACYRRKESVVPHQSLAMMNSGVTQDAARALTARLADETDFVTAAFESVLTRPPTPAEHARCEQFLKQHPAVLRSGQEAFPSGGSARSKPAADPQTRARENLIHVLFLHNDFVTLR